MDFTTNNYQNMQFGIPQGTGYQYMGMPQAVPSKISNVLTQEEIQRLTQSDNIWSLQLTETEALKAACNHRRADGLEDALIEDPVDGKYKCTICGYEFRPVDNQITSTEQLVEDINNVKDILHTIKLLFIDMPKEASREYFRIIPLLDRIPELFKRATDNYLKHTGGYGGMFSRYNNRGMSSMNLYNALIGSFNAMPMNGFSQQPMGYGGMDNSMGAGYYGQPMPGMMPQQPPINAGMASNGFGYNAPGYAPQTAGYQYTPGMMPQQPMPGYGQPMPGMMPQMTPAAPEVPATSVEPVAAPAESAKDVKVKASFKA